MKHKSTVEPLFIKPSEAATLLAASQAWLYRRLEDGSLKSVKLAGQMRRIRRTDFEEFANGSDAND
jgi:excisionase family DNA binding protein